MIEEGKKITSVPVDLPVTDFLREYFDAQHKITQ